MPELQDATVEIGNPGLNGGGVTTTELNTAVAGLAPGNATYITQTANGTLTSEQALSSLATGILKNTTGTGVLSIATGSDLPAHNHTGVVGSAAFIIDGGGATITTGIKGELPPFAFAGTITGFSLTSDQSGSITVEVWKDTMTNFPPTGADIMDTWTLTAATRTPTTGSYNTESHTFAVGDVLRFNVASVTSCQRVTVGIRIERSI